MSSLPVRMEAGSTESPLQLISGCVCLGQGFCGSILVQITPSDFIMWTCSSRSRLRVWFVKQLGCRCVMGMKSGLNYLVKQPAF